MKTKTLVCLLAASLSLASFLPSAFPDAPAQPAIVKPDTAKPKVQIALLLDTSGSMDGLIEQAKTQLWKIVNEFAKSSANGKHPDIEVALYQYGSPNLGADNGYVKQLTELTTDLDKVSEELFKLKTNGGDEYCGTVIKKAAEDLKWADGSRAYKAIFIAGNEPFTQGNVDYKDACKAAITKGIIVNTIHCGSEAEGISGKWKDGAALADGTYMVINQDQKIVQIPAPQDKEIAELNAKINTTYVAYGDKGREGLERQSAQDSNAAKAAPEAAAQRANAKAGNAYKNSSWDLVDAAKDGKVKVNDLKEDQLPDEMKKMDAKEREAYVQKKQKEREEIQTKIKDLSAARDKYVAEKRKEPSADKTLDAAIIDAVRSQAKKADLTFEEPK